MTAHPHQADDPTARASLRELADVERWVAHTGAMKRGVRRFPEEPVEGPVFVVTTSTSDGMHQIVSIWRQLPEGVREATLPPLAGAKLALLRSVVRAVLDLMEHESGHARAEVMLTPQGPRITGLQLNSPSSNRLE
jgi:hypothetical protein